MPNIDLSILNQRQTPAFYADVFANRPAAGFVGRIFVSTDTYAFYRDNGTGWDLIGGPGTGTVTGSGAAGQVAFWSGSSLISGENNLWWDSTNNHFGINTNTPGTAADIHHDQSTILQLNQTTATNDTRIAFQNAGSSKWRVGNFYSAGSNDYKVNDAVLNINRFTIKSSSGQTFVGDETTSSGLFVVNNSSGDAHIVALGATAPSIRVRNAGVGASLQFGLGLATTTNNFIQGATGGEFCIFNDSLTAQPILFGIKDAGLGNTQEAARISAARNFLVGTSVDAGYKLAVNGTINATGRINSGSGGGATASLNAQQLSGDDAAIYAGGVATTGSSKGIKVLAGTNSSDYALNIASYANSPIIYARGDGNVGIGTTSPSSGISSTETTLQIQNGNVAALALNNSASRKYTIYSGVGGQLGFYDVTGGAERITLSSSGNVGIGTTSPNRNTEIISSGGAVLGVSSSSNGSGILYGRIAMYTNFGSNSYIDYGGEIRSYSGAGIDNSDLRFYTANATPSVERMRITNGGNVLIGTSTDAGQKLQVRGNDRIINLISDGSTVNSLLRYSTSAGSKWTTGYNNDNYIIFDDLNNAYRFIIKNTGVINIPTIPTSAAGLSSGDIYSNAGILTRVP